MYDLHYSWLDVRSTKPVSCCLCAEATPSETCFAYKVNDQPFTIQRCPKHDLMFVSPQPSGAFFDTLYNHESYYAGTTDMYGLQMDDVKAAAIGKIRANEALEVLGPFDSFLELGCAGGHTLEAVHALGNKRVRGLEVSDIGVAICQKKNLPVTRMASPSDLSSLGNERFGVIAMYSVLEHVENPLAYMKRVVEYLEPNGKLILRLPKMNKDGPWLSLVDHLWHFSPEGMKNLLDALNLKLLVSMPSGTFIGLEHGGELQSLSYFVLRA